MQASNLNTWEAEAGGLRIGSQPGLHEILSQNFFFSPVSSVMKATAHLVVTVSLD